MKFLLIGAAVIFGLLSLHRIFGAEKGSSRIARPGDSQSEVERLVMAGRKIEAIKMHRRMHGTGLKESKEAVEALASRLEREGPRGSIEP